MFLRSLFFALLSCLLALGPLAADWAVDPEASGLVVVTRKGGFASGQAHNHLVMASAPSITLDLDPASPPESSFEATLEVERLEVDTATVRAFCADRVRELGLADEPFEDVSAKDRGKIREAMLDEGQLDAARYPEIRVAAAGIEAADDPDWPWAIQVEMTIHGATRTVPFRARLQELEAGRWRVEAVGESKFSDFGIEPYSAFLGAVKNLDPFGLYLRLEAEAPATEAPADERGDAPSEVVDPEPGPIEPGTKSNETRLPREGLPL